MNINNFLGYKLSFKVKKNRPNVAIISLAKTNHKLTSFILNSFLYCFPIAFLGSMSTCKENF
jgi:hypothetical protein